MTRSTASEVKRERRKSLFLREITAIFQDLVHEEPTVGQIYISNIDMSSDSGICFVLFSAFKEPGEEVFNSLLSILKLYKPSMRKAFAEKIQTRYAPDLVFVFDKVKEKERRINALLDKVTDELGITPSKERDE
jgi:ribosome-binding factor A